MIADFNLGLKRQRTPKSGARRTRSPKNSGGMIDNREGGSVEQDLLANDLWIAVQSLLPVAIADNSRRMRSPRRRHW